MHDWRKWTGFSPAPNVTPPPTPNPNTAMNQAQSDADAMRARRGVLANIYAGASSTAPVSGKTQLGT
jgi:hypothetical protein